MLHPSAASTFSKTATAFIASDPFDPAVSKSAVWEGPHVPLYVRPLPFAAGWSMTLLLDRTTAAPAVEARERSTKETQKKYGGVTKGARRKHARSTEETRNQDERNTKRTRKEARKDRQWSTSGFCHIFLFFVPVIFRNPAMYWAVTLVGYDAAYLAFTPCHYHVHPPSAIAIKLYQILPKVLMF